MDLTAGNVKQAMQGASSRDLWQVPLGRIKTMPGFNVRQPGPELEAHLEWLADQIMENGYKQDKPLAAFVANEDGEQVIYVYDGHCRLEGAHRAVKRGAQIETLPVVASPKGTAVEDLTVALVTTNSGKPLTEYEIGLVCKRLIGYGWDAAAIGKKLSRSTSRVNDLLTLVGAAPEIRDMVKTGEVSASQAIKTIKKSGAGAAGKLREGVAKAKAAGKRKATARHIDTKPSYKSVVQALLDWKKASEWEIPEDLKPVLKLAKESLE